LQNHQWGRASAASLLYRPSQPFRDPGLTYKEDILSGSRAAVRGGYTAVNLMANTKPVCCSMDIFQYVKNKAMEIGLIDVHQTISITRNLEGKDISHLDEISNEVKFISDDGRGIVDNRVMYDGMKKALEKNFIVISHVEDEKLAAFDTRLSENLMTSRDVALSEYTGCHLHVAHVSTKEAMKCIIASKRKGNNITCEVTPHHIGLTDEVKYKVNPPIRTRSDVSFLINAIKEGWVDAIGTDHAPHSHEDKKNGSPGISGIETSFSVCYTKLVKEGHINLNKLSEIMSKNPGRIMGLNKGKIQIGYDGDLVLVDINKSVMVDADKFQSKGKNTPFDGMKLYGEVKMTIKGGKVVYSGEE
jgi:dihydroorotase